jgi:2-dehydropantoate 2-reductase
MAWQGDLEGGGGRPEGVNFWLPPLLGILLVGNEKACHEVEQLLKKAGFRVTVGKQDAPMQASVTAVMTAFVAGLELSGWSFGAFRKSAWLKRAGHASREAVLGQLSRAGIFTKMLLGMLCSPTVFFLTTFFLPQLFPFDLEKYLKFHYLKTRDQTLTLLDVFARDGERRGLSVENIRMLLEGLLDSG